MKTTSSPGNPEPLTPSDCNLQDFQFMPLDVLRLRDSELASNETPEACWAAVLLWCAAWHQVPAGSIPNDEQWIAKQAGYARRGRIDKEWADVRPGALRGWIECSDGRLYHPVVAEKARDAWQSKLEQRWRSECGRVKKHNQRHGTKVVVPDFVTWLSLGCPQGQPLPVPGDNADQSSGQPPDVPGTVEDGPQDNPGDKGSKGQGEGQGQGDSKKKEMDSAGDGDDYLPNATAAGALAKLLRANGVQDANPGNPTLRAWADAGLTEDEALAGLETARSARAAPDPMTWPYLARVLETQRQKAAAGVPDKPVHAAGSGRRTPSAAQQRADWLAELDDEVRGKPREIDMGVIDATGQR